MKFLASVYRAVSRYFVRRRMIKHAMRTYGWSRRRAVLVIGAIITSGKNVRHNRNLTSQSESSP